MDIKIEKMSLRDLENIKEILTIEFDDFWNYNILKEELNSSNSYYIVAKSKNELENEIVGFAGMKVVIDQSDIMNIVTKKAYRNQGIGNILLKNLILLSKNLQLSSISLEVNEENKAAIYLYKKFGFQQTGFRKNYYQNKNGRIMTLLL